MAQIEQYIQWIPKLTNESVTDCEKLKYVQEVNKNLEIIVNTDGYKVFLDNSVEVYIRILREGKCYFIADSTVQQMRKLILEILYRLPTNELLKPHVQNILTLMFDLLKVDNEKNVLVCLKIIIELHKQYREYLYTIKNPIDMIRNFLSYIKTIYSTLPKKMPKIFKPKVQHTVRHLNETMIEQFLKDTFTTTTIQLEGSKTPHTLIPKAIQSLSILQELPIVIVLMYRIFSEVRQIVGSFIPLIMDTIILRPTDEQRTEEHFNKDTFADFIGAQIKALSFLAYITKDYIEIVKQDSAKLVKGVLSLLELCPMEVAHLRRELLIAARHILATNLRNDFVPNIKCLFNEDILLGHGWTTHESLRPLAYSTLAELVQHVRQQLSLNDLSMAVHLFSKNVHDNSLPTTIQTMSCKLLYNLVESVRLLQVDERKTMESRVLLIRLLKVFVLKFKSIAKIHLPRLIKRVESSETKIEVKEETILWSNQTETSRFMYQQPINYNVNDYKSLVKSLVSGVKNITCVCATTKNDSGQLIVMKQFTSQEIQIYVQLVKWALKAFDVYTLCNGPLEGSVVRLPQVKENLKRTEEREVLENFSAIFPLMYPQNFHEIFHATIEYLVERIAENAALQTIPRTLLVNSTSPVFATILVEYLLEKMDEMGTNPKKSDLYLGLFKLAFGSVSLFPTEIGNMLRPHLHQFINKSMDLAMRANDPYNYFLLLRALFRSIANGKHDLLYLEFIPLLPNLLESLNHLQSGCHKQMMKDVLVELCFVPLRLSSLLPYLYMLMDPLISALNLKGSDFFSKGLGILENFVDNLRPNYLNELIQPFLPDLLQALWKILWNNDKVAQTVFKLLGKLGGCNREIMYVPQKLNFVHSDYQPTTIRFKLNGLETCIEMAIDEIIETSYNIVKQTNLDVFYRRQAWECIKCYLKCTGCTRNVLNVNQMHCYRNEEMVTGVKGVWYKSNDVQARKTHQYALTAMFIIGSTRIDPDIDCIIENVVQYYTIVAIRQQIGSESFVPKPNNETNLDPLVFIDALATIIGNEERNFCAIGYKALEILLNTATYLIGDLEKACDLPLIDYLTEQMCNLCYERPCYAKLGGCLVIKYLHERCSVKWLYLHIFKFLKSFFFVMMDLTGEVSCGAVDRAKENLNMMLTALVQHVEVNALQMQALSDVCNELVRQINSPHLVLREQALESLRLLADKQNVTVTDVIRPCKSLLEDLVPPKKNLLKQPIVAQLVLMDGIAFCVSLKPRLFTIDMSIQEHKTFVNDVISICTTDDASLNEISSYKSVTNFIPLRISAIKVLASLYYLNEIRNEIFCILYDGLKSTNDELQFVAFGCMRTFIDGAVMDMEFVQETVKSATNVIEIHQLIDVKNVSICKLRLLLYLTQLFPDIFNEKHCEQLLKVLELLLDIISIQSGSYVSRQGDTEQIVVTLLTIFQHSKIATSKYILKLCQLRLMETRLPFCYDLMKFLLRYPGESMELFLSDQYIKETPFNVYLEYILQHGDGKVFRDYIQTNMVHRLMELAMKCDGEKEYRYQAIKIVHLLIKYDDQWLMTQRNLVNCLQQIWCDENYQETHKNINDIDSKYWNEPKLLVKIMLQYFCYWPTDDYNLLFQLLRAFNVRLIADFQFLHDFLQNTVCYYMVEWKRCAFFKFVELFNQDGMSNELKAKVIQHIIIPSFAVSFERNETEKLIGNRSDSNNNIVVVFITLLNPATHHHSSDCIRIALYQLACLLVDQAHDHIRGEELRLNTLQAFAGRYLQVENSVDPSTRYHGHLLLAHIINKFKLNAKIVRQCYCMLLKAHAIEARNIVCQALDIIIQSLTEDDYLWLAHCTKKILVDEGHSTQQLYHTLQLIIKHHNIYYHIRNHIIQNMVTAIQKLSCGTSATLEQKKLAVEFTDVVLNWALYHKKNRSMKRTLSEENLMEKEPKKIVLETGVQLCPAGTSRIKTEPGTSIVIEQQTYTDYVLNCLLQLAFKINEPSGQNQQAIAMANGPGELLSRRCVNKLQEALDPGNWPKRIDLKLMFFDRYLMRIEDTSNQYLNNIYLALEFLTYALDVLNDEKIPEQYKMLVKSMCACLKSTDRRIIELMTNLLEKLFGKFPVPNKIVEQEWTAYGNVVIKQEYSENQFCNEIPKWYDGEPFGQLYGFVEIFIGNHLNVNGNLQEDQNGQKRLLMCVKLLKAACKSNATYIYGYIEPFMNVMEHLGDDQLILSKSAIIHEILIICLDLAKNCLTVMSEHVRKVFIEAILVNIIEKSADVQVLKAVINMLDEWTRKSATNSANLRILYLKLMYEIEKRFPNDEELTRNYFELILFIYTDRLYCTSELSVKLEAAFIRGLCCKQHEIRLKFVQLFDELMGNLENNVQNRLLYIISSRNWDATGQHYFIKQCIELLLIACESSEEMNLSKHFNLTEKEPVMTVEFLRAVTELCHLDSNLAKNVWLELFPKLWNTFNTEEQYIFSRELNAFIQSTCSLVQENCEPNAINTFVEAMCRCKNTKIEIPPTLMVKLGKQHNLWHRMALELENASLDVLDCVDFQEIYYNRSVENVKIETILCLSDLYAMLCEEDLWCGLWAKVAYYNETKSAIVYEQFGYYDYAKSAYEQAMERHTANSLMNLPVHVENEVELWDEHWIRCAKELNEWDTLLEYAQTTNDPYLLLDSVWRCADPKWDLMREYLRKLEPNCVMEYRWRTTIYKGYLRIFQQQNLDQTDTWRLFIEPTIGLCLKQWRQLPQIVGHIHLEYLRAAQQILELQEICQIWKEFTKRNNPFDHVKSMMKTWSNRLPSIGDDLCHWNEILMWRQHFYKFIINYDGDQNSSMSFLCRHARAQCNIVLSATTRKHHLPAIALNLLNRYEFANSDHDLFEKYRQQIKNHLQIASLNGDGGSLETALGIIRHIEEENYFNKEKMKSELYALKGTLLQYKGESDEANNAFSTAIKLFNTSSKAWSLYGEYLERVFLCERQLIYGQGAIKCFLHACRDQNESKARKYLAKVLWLLNYDDTSLSLNESLERYSYGVPSILWFPWIPQLITFILQSENKAITSILCDVGKMFPQAVFVPLWPIYLTLKTNSIFKNSSPQKPNQNENSTEVKGTPSMKRFSSIILMLENVHTTIFSCLARIAEQMESFKEEWHEKVLQQLRQGLIKCYAIAFEHALNSTDSVNDAKIPKTILKFVKTLMSNCGIGNNDVELNKMQMEFENDFDFKQSNSMRLHSLIFKLKKWIKILENHSKLRLQSILMEDECRFLSNFTLKTTEIALPGEFLLPKDINKFIRISKFMCRIDIVQKYNVTARRLYILGHNGKIYPYLVAPNSSREERVLQVLRMLNLFLGKQKETSKRLLYCHVPKVIAVSRRMRLIEDNPDSVSLLDIFKKAQERSNDDPIYFYYQRLAIAQSRCVNIDQQAYKEIFNEIQKEMVAKDVFKRWVVKTYPSATDYWQFRKMFTLQLSLACFYEYVLHLTRLNPEMIYIHQDTGLLNMSFFQFDVESESGAFAMCRPVPFRLTPNIVEFLPSLVMNGPLIASMIAAARCFVNPNYKFDSILRPILRDEMVLLKPDDIEMDNEKVIRVVDKAVDQIVGRLESLAMFDGVNSKAASLVNDAINYDNLCKMDPTWYPWL